MTLSHLVQSPIAIAARLALLLAVAPLTACQSTPQSVRPEWSWKKPLTFTTTATPSKKLYFKWQDIEAVDEFDNVKNDIIDILTSPPYDLELVADPEQADYACHVMLRYFNANPEPDDGAKLVSLAGNVEGGFPGWLRSDGTTADTVASPSDIPPLGEKTGIFAGGSEWDILIDIAIGEKGGEQTAPDKFVRREGRLLGSVKGSGIKRDQALWLVRYGSMPPAPVKQKDGTIVPPVVPQTSKELVNRLVKAILPLP